MMTTECPVCGGGTGMKDPCTCGVVYRENLLIAEAIEILTSRLRKRYPNTLLVMGMEDIKNLVVLHYAGVQREEFKCIFLDAQQRLVSFETLAIGTVSQCPTYPREFIKMGLNCNASYAVLVHNHPNGNISPSRDDGVLTKHMGECFQMVDIALVDHLIVAGTQVFSITDNKLL